MRTIIVDETLTEWDNACITNDLERWVEHLDRVPVCDFFPVLVDREVLTRGTKLLSLSKWLNLMGTRRYDDIVASTDIKNPATVRLASATYLRWLDRIETLLKTSRLPNLPDNGVVQYFTDYLAASVLVGYTRIGSTIQLGALLAIPNPVAYLDPLRLLRFAQTQEQLDLLRKSLYNRHKVVIQRNTLIHVDRERSSDVFGPAIDTLFLNDWLHVNRYSRQRTMENSIFFEDPVSRHATSTSQNEGRTFLEIGCGNGLLTASFAKNEAKIRSYAAIDVSPAAVSLTYENVSTQRQFHGQAVGARGRFTIGRYRLDAVPARSDLVICNPPYIPKPSFHLGSATNHPLATATVGTELLMEVISDCENLISPTGELLMVSSTLAEMEITAATPPGITCQRVASRSVPFNVEAVRGEGGDAHVAWLQGERGLLVKNGELFHDIAIYRFTHSTQAANRSEI